MVRQGPGWEKMFAKYILDKGLLYIIYIMNSHWPIISKKKKKKTQMVRVSEKTLNHDETYNLISCDIHTHTHTLINTKPGDEKNYMSLGKYTLKLQSDINTPMRVAEINKQPQDKDVEQFGQSCLS